MMRPVAKRPDIDAMGLKFCGNGMFRGHPLLSIDMPANKLQIKNGELRNKFGGGLVTWKGVLHVVYGINSFSTALENNAGTIHLLIRPF